MSEDRFKCDVTEYGITHAVELLSRQLNETIEKAWGLFPSEEAFRAGVAAALGRCVHTAKMVKERDAWRQKAQAHLRMGIGAAARERREADEKLIAVGVDPNAVPEES